MTGQPGSTGVLIVFATRNGAFFLFYSYQGGAGYLEVEGARYQIGGRLSVKVFAVDIGNLGKLKHNMAHKVTNKEACQETKSKEWETARRQVVWHVYL